MEFNTNCENDLNVLPLPAAISDTNFKLDIFDDDFCTDNLSSSKGYLQNFPDPDKLSFTASSFDLGIEIQANGLDSFDPLCHGSSAYFGMYEFKPYEKVGSMNAAMQDLRDGGLLNFSEMADSFMGIETALEYHDPKSFCFVVPDETSCVTANNLGCLKGNGGKRNMNSVRSRGSESGSSERSSRGRKKPKSAKGQWTAEEDRLLIHLVEKYGVRKWSNIAQMLKGRIGKQCRERWHNHLRPDIKKDVWTEEEDRILIEVHAQVGNKWAEIAKSLPGRTENTIKNHWNATKRRQFTKRKCRTKWPKPSSLLQNYIKNLASEKEGCKRKKNVQTPATAQPETLPDSPVSPQKKTEIEFSPDYGFDEVPDFTFDDDHMDSFMDDIPIGFPPEIDEELCFDVELPSDVTQLMQCDVKTELDFFDGIV